MSNDVKEESVADLSNDGTANVVSTYKQQVDNKVSEILPLLSGQSINTIEDILAKVISISRTFPIAIVLNQNP